MNTYIAHGLLVRSAFELPGMKPREEEALPSLEIEPASAATLASRWSGAEGPPVWVGELGDGSELVLERGIAGELRFTHGECARHLLDPSARELLCAGGPESLRWQRALLTKILPIVGLIGGYEALHASAVSSPLGAVAVLAPSGAGKSTLAAALVSRGWPLIGDDILTLEHTPAGVRAHPGTPHMNLAAEPASASQSAPGRTLGEICGERWVALDSAAFRAEPVHAICLLERGEGLALEARVLPANPLSLAPYMLGLPSGAMRERRRFELYASLMSSATLLRLSCGPGEGPEELAELLADATLGLPSPSAMAGVG